MSHPTAAAMSKGLPCPSCSKKGKSVKPLTLNALLEPTSRDQVTEGPYRFCESPGCETVYYAEDGSHSFLKSDLTVRVGIKESEAPRYVCYCFDHTIEEIEEQVKRTGESTVLNDIKTRMKDGCWCETKSPEGSCCMRAVNWQIKAARARYATSAAGAATQTSEPFEASCAPGAREGAGRSQPVRWSVGALAPLGAVVSAVITSACCWLPLALLAFGISGGTLSAAFEQYRPIFLPITFVLLGAAFYFAYRRPQAAAAPGTGSDADACCAVPSETGEDAACCPPAHKKGFPLKKLNKVMLWPVTLVVLAFTFFPNYVGLLLGGGPPLSAGDAQLVVKVEGMTCQGCAATLEKALAALPSVSGVEVSYERGEARVSSPKGTEMPRAGILAAIAKAGFRGTVARGGVSRAGRQEERGVGGRADR